MRKYYKIITNQIAINFSYRFNLLSKIAINSLQFIMLYFIWKSIYSSSGLNKIGEYNSMEMSIYILITNLTIVLYNFTHMHRLARLVKTGKLSTILLRPISIIKESFFEYLGSKVSIFTLFILIVLIAKIEYKPFVIIYILISLLMHFYVLATISTIGFWILQTWSLNGLLNGIFLILSGTYFPLDLLPKYIFNIIKYNPFSLVSYTLARILQSKVSFNELITYIVVCVIWCVILRILLSILMKMGLKNYEGMGA